jgi:hypothetical protein
MSDIVIQMNSTLDKQTVEEIVKQFVEKQTGKAVDKIEAKMNENLFVGFTITYVSETSNLSTKYDRPKKPIVIDTTFKPMVYD